MKWNRYLLCHNDCHFACRFITLLPASASKPTDRRLLSSALHPTTLLCGSFRLLKPTSRRNQRRRIEVLESPLGAFGFLSLFSAFLVRDSAKLDVDFCFRNIFPSLHSRVVFFLSRPFFFFRFRFLYLNSERLLIFCVFFFCFSGPLRSAEKRDRRARREGTASALRSNKKKIFSY